VLRTRRWGVAGLVLAVALVPQAGAARTDAGQDRVLLVYNCKSGKFKPRSVIITCADGNFRVRGIQWSSWTRREARGTGTALVNDCDPNCAEGTFRHYAIRLRAYRPRRTGGCVPGSLFTRLGWRFPRGRLPNSEATGRTTLVCPASGA
jgi:hypothetical protein